MKQVLVFPGLILFCNACGGLTERARSSAAGVDGSTAVDASAAIERTVAADGGNVTDGGNAGVAMVKGTAGGQSFSSNEVIAAVEYLPPMDSPAPSSVTLVVPANFLATCTELNDDCAQNTAHPNEAAVSISLSTPLPETSPLAPGTYSVTASAAADGAVGTTVSVSFGATDANCARTTPESPTGGSVTVTAVDRSAIAGNFDFDFQNGDRLQGEFSAPYCVFSGGNCGNIEAPRPPKCVP